MTVRARVGRFFPRQQPEIPVVALDNRWSVVSSAVDLRPAPGDDLVGLMLRAGERARSIDLADLAARAGSDDERAWLSQWPGEHYRLLAALVDVLQPQTVVEVGTWQGLGTLSLARFLPPGGRVVTYDVLPWDQIDGSLLRATDLTDGAIEQRLGDLADPRVFDRERDLLRSADIIFSDAPKDGRFEPAFLSLLLPATADRRRLLVLDDIRLLPMVQLWRDLPLAKLDATSVGHWSGTGLAFTA